VKSIPSSFTFSEEYFLSVSTTNWLVILFLAGDTLSIQAWISLLVATIGMVMTNIKMKA